MTLDQIQALTDDEIRVRVAEICGWADIREEDRSGFGGYRGTDPNGKTLSFVPNYPADLNACAEMERTMTRAQLWLFDDYMLHICRDAMMAKHATARQRCQAFLTVMGDFAR